MPATIPATNKVIQIHEIGGPEVIKYEEIPIPEITETQILVKNKYAGVNFLDVGIRRGTYPSPLPSILGREAVGEIVKVGSKVTGYSVGDKIGYFGPAYTQYTAVESTDLRILKIPSDSKVDEKLVAASLIQVLTAYAFTKETYPVKKGDYILVHAAAGGTGSHIVQFAKLAGAIVIGTTSSPEKAAIAKEAGADYVINYKLENTVDRVNEITNGNGVAAVFDGVGKDTWDTSVAAVARKGTLVSFGASSGAVPPDSLASLGRTPKNIKYVRAAVFGYLTTPEEWASYSNGLLKLLADGDIKINISKIYPLDQTAQAISDIESGKTVGKLLIEIN